VVIALFSTRIRITPWGEGGENPILKEKYKGYKVQKGGDSAITHFGVIIFFYQLVFLVPIFGGRTVLRLVVIALFPT
jgi:hypothetical protein